MKKKVQEELMATILHPLIYKILADLPETITLYENAVKTDDWLPIEEKLEALIAEDEHQADMIKEQKGQKYYKPFHRVVVSKILPALQYYLPRKEIPRVTISFEEADECRKIMGFKAYGSAQDFLYGFTSERYTKWGPSLTELGFRAACMSGVASAEVWLIDDRYLNPSKNEPDFETIELSGGIGKDFYETAHAVSANPSSFLISQLCLATGTDLVELELFLRSRKKTDTKDRKIERLKELCELALEEQYSALVKSQAKALLNNIEESKTPTSLLKEERGVSQEQIGLKYCEEGKYLQKLFNGSRVEHFQSNVKMVTNPLRKNKVEADSIYRIVAEKKIIILEAKGKSTISKTQLYQLYETFKLKLPVGWDLEIVALFLTEKEKTKIIDLVQVSFDESVFGNIGESLAEMAIHKHYRWLIKA